MPIELTILLKDKKAEAQFRRFAKGTTIGIQKMEKQSVTSSKKMSAAFQGVGRTLGALGIGFGAAVAIRGLKGLVDAASDTEESMNKVIEVFGGASDSVIKFSNDAATALGASKQEALAMTGELGNLLVAFGFAEQKAADMSTSMVQLAADLGSFNNVPTVDALNAIRSALVGEAEPMKRFGSDVRQVRLDQIALASGMEFTKGKMDAQTKALAAMETILQDTTKAQGDFKRTSDGLANSSKTLEALTSDLSSSLGEILIPVVKEVVIQMSAAVKGITSFLEVKTGDKKREFQIQQITAEIKELDKWIKLSQEARAGDKALLDFRSEEAILKDIVGWEKDRIDLTKKLIDLNKKPGSKITGGGGKEVDREAQLRGEILASIKLQETKLRIIRQLKIQGLIPLEIEKTKLGEIREDEIKRRAAVRGVVLEEKEIVKLKKIQVEESGLQLRAQLILNQAVFSMADGIGQAIVQGRELSSVFKNILGQILSTGISATIFGGFSALTGGGFATGFDKFFGFAGGGRPVSGRPNIVGERGPEVFVPDSPGKIVPNNQISNSFGNISLSFPNVKTLNQEEMRRMVIPMLQNTLRQFGSRIS